MSIPLLTVSSVIAVFSYKNIISPLLQTISSTKDLLFSIKTTNINISERLKELGFVSKIEIISLFLLELETYDQDMINSNQTHFIRTFTALIKEITYTLETMKNTLHNIENKVLYHNSLYFSSWRTLDCEKELIILIKYNIILNEQFKTLIDILSIMKENKNIITYVRN